MSRDPGFVLRPATRDDLAALYPERVGPTVRAWAVEYRGELAVVAGMTVEPWRLIAFSDVRPGLNAPRATVWRAARELFARMTESHAPLLAVACPTIQGSGRMLERLGFMKINEDEQKGDTYLWSC